MGTRGYRELRAWQKAMELMMEVYRISDRFPKQELFGLTRQLRRAALSIPANIAEGDGREHRGDYLRHLSIARGSVSELDTLLDAAARLSYCRGEDLRLAVELTDHVGRMLTRLIERLKGERVGRGPRGEGRATRC